MRGILVVNPNATTTSPRVRDVLVHALGGAVDLEVVTTERRGHAIELGRRARAEGIDIVLTLGGDGTINETVNGLLADGPGDDVPMLATVPGGSANVFARALGLPADPVEATGVLLEALETGTPRTIGLGTITVDAGTPQWFLANAGMGIDAEIIAAMERERERGREATPGRYLRLTVRQYLRGTDRRHPALTVQAAGADPIDGVFLAIIQNTRPWTYFGSRPIHPCPQADFDTGLDLFALRDLGVWSTAAAARQLLTGGAGSTARSRTVLHDCPVLTVEASRPMEVQVDGEHLGPAAHLEAASVPSALRVVCLPASGSPIIGA